MDLRPFTLPNFLTFLRLVALPFLVVAILEGRHRAALLIFLAAAITDIVDGYLARHFGMASPLGAWLDPIADKLFLVSTFVVFALKSTPSELHVPIWLLVLTIFRDVLILVVSLVMFLALGTRDFPPSWLGKLTTFSEVCAVVAILLTNVGALPPAVARACFGAVAVLTISSGLHYVFRASRGLASHPPPA
jgi:cardiolipin synthase